MSILDDDKFSVDDFSSFEVIDSWWNQYSNKKDKEGYTPIGAAVLNSASRECIAYLMQLYTFNGNPEESYYNVLHPFRDILYDRSKGKSPLEIACMVMSIEAVDVLMNNYLVYQLKDEDGNAIPKMTCYGEPLVDVDSNGEVTKEYYMYSSIPLWSEYTKESYKYTNKEDLGIKESYKYKHCECLESDILAASILQKPDILKKLIDKFKLSHYQYNLSSVTDSNGNNPLIFACLANCYESVDYLLENNNHDDNNKLVNNTNSDDVSALSVALQSNDDDLIIKLLEFVPIDELLRQAFSKNDHKMINMILLQIVPKRSNIYNYYDKEYALQDGSTILVATYIEDENNDKLYELFNNDSYNYNIHFNTLENHSCCHIIAVLYRNNKKPFDSVSAKFDELINNHQSIYIDTVMILFKSDDITLTQILNIANINKRYTLVDKIFTTPYRKDLFLQLVVLINDPSIYNATLDAISHLYDRNYFTLQNLADLSEDSSISSDSIFSIIDSLAVTLSVIDKSLEDNEFKKELVFYLYDNNKVSLADIDSDISNLDFKTSIIIDIFNSSDYNVTVEDILLLLSSSTVCRVINELYLAGDIIIPDDVYIIYKNYRDDLSSLNNDLKPLIGCRKFIDSEDISSDFYWAYSFKDHAGTNWNTPMYYQSSTPPIMDSLLMPVDGTRYKTVLLYDSASDVVFSPTHFRLNKFNNLPEFYTNTPYDATSDRNSMIVSFNKSVVRYTFSLPDDMYSISSDNEITWNKDHILYRSLFNSRCYSDSEAQAAIIFNNSYESIVEGEAVTRDFRLSTKPRSHVVLSIRSNQPRRLHISSDKLIFTSTNWNIDQTVTFTAIDDSIDNDDANITITIAVTSSDSRYNDTLDDSFYFRVIDNDNAGIIYDSSSIILSEGSSISRSYRLQSQPKSNVTLNISSNDTNSRLSISKSSLVFTASNWNIEQSVIFTAIDNNIKDDDADVLVTIKSSSTDLSYNNLTNVFMITVKDDDIDNKIGTYAFSSGLFTILLVDDADKMIWSKPISSGSYSTSEYTIKDQWSSVYDEGYTVTQVPKSPNWTSGDKVFNYDLLYDDNLDE